MDDQLPLNNTPLNARVPRSLRSWLDDYARRQRVNRSEALRRLLEDARERDSIGRAA